jgi:hypothetical protein
MANLTRASQELFRRSPDERFPSLGIGGLVPPGEAGLTGPLAPAAVA